MDEKDIAILLALSDYKNLTRVAEYLYMTQPALTSRIKRLEESLGAQLLYRNSRGIQFTPSGLIVVDYAKKISAEMQKMREQVQADINEVSGSLHIGCSMQYARWAFPPILKRFMENYHRITVDIVADRSINLLRELNRNTYSVAIIRGDFKWRGERFLIFRENYCLVCKDENARNNLQHIPYIHQKADNRGLEMADEWVQNNISFQPIPRIESNNIEICKSLIAQGYGWSVLPEICLSGFDGYKETLHLSDNLPLVRNTYLCYRSSEAKLPPVQAFISYMRDLSCMRAPSEQQ